MRLLSAVIISAYPILAFGPWAFASQSFSSLPSCYLNYELPRGTNPRETFIRHLSCYVFDGISGQYDHNCRVSAAGCLEISQLPVDASTSLTKIITDQTNPTILAEVRHWWDDWSYSLRPLRGHQEVIPETLSEFILLSPFKSWPKTIITRSHVKNKTRIIYRRDQQGSNISVSETLNSTTGDTLAEVIETEVVLERKDQSGNFDFYVYDRHGQLSNRAEFPAGIRSAPSSCMSCHYSAISGKFERTGR